MNLVHKEKVAVDQFEFVEFQVGNNNYGIAISNVREIIQPVPVTVIPHSHQYVEGIIQLRGEVLPVINLKKVVGFSSDNGVSDSIYIVLELEGKTVVFHVSAVTQIQRIPFSEVNEADEMYTGKELPITGIVKRDDCMVLIIDIENIVTELLR